MSVFIHALGSVFLFIKNKIEYIFDEDYVPHILCNFIQWTELTSAQNTLILGD
jgi:hypothetical protein